MKYEPFEEARQALSGLGVNALPEWKLAFAEYHRLLEKWSRRVRLVGSTDERVVAVKHFADSWALIPFLDWMPAGATVLDIGSGAGFPGIPLAVARRDLRFVLVESDHRKTAFLAAAIAALRLDNVRVESVRVSGRPSDERLPKGQLVVSRALMEASLWLPLARGYVDEDGCIAAMLGASAPDESELRRLGEGNDLELWRIWSGQLEGAGRRVLVLWRASGSTSERTPSTGPITHR